jgi:hypothetical protein
VEPEMTRLCELHIGLARHASTCTNKIQQSGEMNWQLG